MSLASKQRAFSNSQAHPQTIIQIGKMDSTTKSKQSVRQVWCPQVIKVTLLQNTDENIHEVAEILKKKSVWIQSKNRTYLDFV